MRSVKGLGGAANQFPRVYEAIFYTGLAYGLENSTCGRRLVQEVPRLLPYTEIVRRLQRSTEAESA